MVCLLSKVLLKLLNQTKGTILITTLENIHIIGENSKWILFLLLLFHFYSIKIRIRFLQVTYLWQAKDRFCISGYLKLNKGFATWFSTFCENFALILKNQKNKAKRQLPFFHVPYMPYFKWNVSFTKVLQKCSLIQVTILCSFWNCKNCIKIGKHKIE